MLLGVWKAVGVNDLFKFSKYEKGEKFLPHIDNAYAPSATRRSIFTVIIYLNDDFTGGRTRFYKRQQDIPFLEQLDNNAILETVVPKTGSCVIFNHDLLHDGEAITQGTKYIIRTEVMFEKQSDSAAVLANYRLLDEQFLKSSMLYMRAEELEKQGLLFESTKTYLKALQIQVNYSPSTVKQSSIFEQSVPYPILVRALCYLNDAKSVLSASLVSRRWNYAAMEGMVWRPLYTRVFGKNTNQYCSNWYYNFRDDTRSTKGIGMPVFVLGYNSLYIGYAGCQSPKYVEPAVYDAVIYSHGLDVSEFVVGSKAVNQSSDYKALYTYFESYNASDKHVVNSCKEFLNIPLSSDCLFVSSNVKWIDTAAHVVHSSFAAMIGSGMTTGVFIYCGAAHTHFQIIYERQIAFSFSTQFGGFDMDAKVSYSFNESSDATTYQIRKQMKAKHFQVLPMDYEMDYDNMKTFDVGNDISIDEYEINEAAEELVSRLTHGLEYLSNNASKYMSCFSTIVLAGGISMIRGLPIRLQQEVTRKYAKYSPQVVAHPDRNKFKWIGASQIASNLDKYKSYLLT